MNAPQPSRRISDGSLTGQVLVCLAVVSIVELLLLRTFTRTAIHIPDVEALQSPLEVISAAGRYAYFLTIAVLGVSVPLACTMLWKTWSKAGTVAATALAGFALAAAGAAAGVDDRGVLDAATLTAVVLLAGAVLTNMGWRRGLAGAFFALAFLAAGLHTAVQSWEPVVLSEDTGKGLLLTAEIAAFAFGISTPLLAQRRPGRAAVATGLVAALVTAAMFQAGGGSTARILMLWNGGVQGALPGILYAAAAGAVAMTITGRAKERAWLEVAGMVLLFTGGVGLHNTYQSGLALVGLACLVLAVAERPAGAARASAVEGGGRRRSWSAVA
jgi:hypothetical protein